MQHPKNVPSINDPTMIHPKGHKVMVNRYKVKELLKKGYVLEDPKWTLKEEEETKEMLIPSFDPPEPPSREEIEKDLAEAYDTLEVIEV